MPQSIPLMLLFFYSKLVLKLLYFHFCTFRNFKHYYLLFIKGTVKFYFPKAVSYNRFVELVPAHVLP